MRISTTLFIQYSPYNTDIEYGDLTKLLNILKCTCTLNFIVRSVMNRIIVQVKSQIHHIQYLIS